MKQHELSITPDYVSHWGVKEAVREIIQNALDSNFTWSTTDNEELRIMSEDVILELKHLMLGSTTKADDDSKIGSFGEGFKIAMGVLVREGYYIEVWNGDRKWVPKFKLNKKYDCETLRIEDHEGNKGNNDLIFAIRGLSDQDMEAIKESCLQMQGDLAEPLVETKYGDILSDKPGKLYVNGLFICDTGLEYGYNIKPEHITLERDRQTVDDWDLNIVTYKMWESTKDWKMLAKMIERTCPDLRLAEYRACDEVIAACLELFGELYPGRFLVRSQWDADQMKDQNPVVYSNVFGALVSRSPKVIYKVPPPPTPTKVIGEWFAKNRKHMRRRGIISFDQLIESAEKWKA